MVPLKLVNFTPLQPAEECETSNHGTVFGKYDECLAIRKNVCRETGELHHRVSAESVGNQSSSVAASILSGSTSVYTSSSA